MKIEFCTRDTVFNFLDHLNTYNLQNRGEPVGISYELFMCENTQSYTLKLLKLTKKIFLGYYLLKHLKVLISISLRPELVVRKLTKTFSGSMLALGFS